MCAPKRNKSTSMGAKKRGRPPGSTSRTGGLVGNNTTQQITPGGGKKRGNVTLRDEDSSSKKVKSNDMEVDGVGVDFTNILAEADEAQSRQEP